MPRRVCVKVRDPRSFYLIVNLLRERGVSYGVPREVDEDCGPSDVKITDDENEPGDGSVLIIPRTVSEEFLEALIDRVSLLSLGLDRNRSLIIGIDIGKETFGVAVLVDYYLVHAEVTDKQGLFLLINRYVKGNFSEKYIKIGVTQSNFDRAIDLANELYSYFKVRVGLVDEGRSNVTHLKLKSRKLNKDEMAAYNISLREPSIIYANSTDEYRRGG